MTYDEFCTSYTPGRYERVTTQADIEHAADLLQHILANALYRLDHHRLAA